MSSNTWTQDWNDARRTSYSPITPSLPWTFKWGWNGPTSTIGTTNAHVYDAPREARPVCSPTQIFVPAGDHPTDIIADHTETNATNAITALDTATGVTNWTFGAGLTSAGSPAYDPNTACLIVGCTNGTVYKLRAADGATMSSLALGVGALRKAVTLAGSAAYVVTDQGKLVKLSLGVTTAAAMSVTWVHTPAGTPGVAQTPPTYAALGGGRLIYCTADLFTHCVVDSDGSTAWSVIPNPTPPVQANDSTGNPIFSYLWGWPVVAEQHGLVFVRMRTVNDLDGAGYTVFHRTANLVPGTMAEIRSYLTTNASQQTLFALNLSDGTRAFTPAVAWNSAEGYVTEPFVISAITYVGTTVTVTLASSVPLVVGENVLITGAAGFGDNTIINGNHAVASAPSGTVFTFTASGTPTGSYTASSATYNRAEAHGTIPQMPVVKVWPNGDEVAYCMFRSFADCINTTFAAQGVDDGRWAGKLGEMVLDSTTVPGMAAGDLRYIAFAGFSGSGNTVTGNSDIYIADEQKPLVLAGTTIFHNHSLAVETASLGSRATSLGLVWNNPIPTTNLPVVLRGTFDSTPGDANTSTHFWTTSPSAKGFAGGGSRSWLTYPNGSGSAGAFWAYWNVMEPPNEPQPGSGPSLRSGPEATRPYTTIVSDQMVYVVGGGGDITAFQHSGTVTAPSATTIGTVTPNLTTLAPRAKLELTFPITGSTETRWLKQRYADTSAPVGVPQGTGITVMGQFLAPGLSDWSQALQQRGYFAVDYTYTTATWGGASGTPHYVPSNTGQWHVRFAPTPTAGVWSYRIQVTDGNGLATSAIQTFTVTGAVDNAGPIVVSPLDSRYFTRDDGSYVPIQGLDDNVVPQNFSQATLLAGLTAHSGHSTMCVRPWMSATTVCGGGWAPMVNFNVTPAGNVNGWQGLVVPASLPTAYEPNAKLVYQLNRAFANPPILVYGFNHGPVACKPSTTYRITLIARTEGAVAAGGRTLGVDAGLTVKFMDQNIGAYVANLAGATARTPYIGSDTWSTIGTGSASYTTGASENYLGCLTGSAAMFTYVVLENTSAGLGDVYDLLCQEDLGGGNFGPNLYWKACADSLFRDTGDVPAAAWDYGMDQAKAQSVFVKPVVLDKDDEVWGHLAATGATNTTYNPLAFISGPNTQNRFWQALAAEYVAARWGYTPSVFEWELINEGGPNTAANYNTAGAFATALQAADAHKHLVSTSVQTTQPLRPDLWEQAEASATSLTDIHAYISTGLDGSGFEWDPPSNMTLDPSGALTLAAGAPAPFNSPSLLIQGMGTWTFQCDIKPQGVNAANDGSTLYGPQVFWQIVDSTGANIASSPRVLPDTGPYFTGTGPIGTTGYVTYSATISVPTTAWYTFNMNFQMSHAASGAGWYTNLKLFDPSGRQWRLVGNGTFLDHDDTWHDTAYQSRVYGRLWGAKAANGVRNKPLIRGEFAMDGPVGTTMRNGAPSTFPTEDEASVMQSDTHGVWLHNFLWGHLDPGGLHDFIWYWSAAASAPNYSITQNNLFFHIVNYVAFAKLLPLTNGHYIDAFPAGSPAPSSSTTDAIGQKDLVNNRAHVWVRDKSFKWPNAPGVPGAGTINSPSGTLPIVGLASGVYTVDLWLFTADGTLTSAASTLTSVSGTIIMDLSALSAAHPGLTDFGMRLSPTGPGSVTMVSYPVEIRNSSGVLQTGLTPSFKNGHLRTIPGQAVVTAPSVTEVNAADFPGAYFTNYDPVANGDAGGTLLTGLAAPFDQINVMLTREAALLLTNLDAQSSTIVQTGLTAQGFTSTRAGYIDQVNGVVANVWAAGTRALTDKAGFVDTSSITSAIFNYVVEPNLTFLGHMRLAAAALFGKSNAAGDTFRDFNDTKNRIAATVDVNGNRTAVTRDQT